MEASMPEAHKERIDIRHTRHHTVLKIGRSMRNPFIVCGWIELLVRGRSAHVADSCNKATRYIMSLKM
jgi:hypothetical protein